MNKDVVQTIKNYILELKRKNSINKKDIYENSCCICAAMDVLGYIWSHPNMTPVEAVKNFVVVLDEMEWTSTFNATVFTVAYDTAVYILNLLTKEG